MKSEQILLRKDINIFEQDSRLDLKELYFKNYRDLYYYGLKLSGSEEISKDCIQDLFIQFWSDCGQLEHVLSPKAYLLKCLRRRILSHLVLEKKFSYIDNEFDQYFPSVNSAEEELLATESKSILERKLNTAKKELSKRQQEVLFLKYSMGYPYSVICDIMNIKYQSVRNLLSESIKLLRIKLESEDHIH